MFRFFDRGPQGTMTRAQAALWRRISEFEFDPADAVRTFRTRLVEETKWTGGFADGAIEEYRKFVFLAVAADHSVSPSKVVDEVWHLHLLDTVSYWQTLCRDTLQREIHHHPSRGRYQEDAAYSSHYRDTLTSYRHFFGPVQVDYWPAAVEPKKASPQNSRTPVKRARPTTREASRQTKPESSSSLVNSDSGWSFPSLLDSTPHAAPDSFSGSAFSGGESGGAGGGTSWGDSGSGSSSDSGSSSGGSSCGSSSGGDSGGSSCGGSSCGGGGCGGD